MALDDPLRRVRHRLRELGRKTRLLAAELQAVLEMADDLVEHRERAAVARGARGMQRRAVMADHHARGVRRR
jgi:hypothetical protein